MTLSILDCSREALEELLTLTPEELEVFNGIEVGKTYTFKDEVTGSYPHRQVISHNEIFEVEDISPTGLLRIRILSSEEKWNVNDRFETVPMGIVRVSGESIRASAIGGRVKTYREDVRWGIIVDVKEEDYIIQPYNQEGEPMEQERVTPSSVERTNLLLPSYKNEELPYRGSTPFHIKEEYLADYGYDGLNERDVMFFFGGVEYNMETQEVGIKTVMGEEKIIVPIYKILGVAEGLSSYNVEEANPFTLITNYKNLQYYKGQRLEELAEKEGL